MFYICKKNETSDGVYYGVMDTEDGVVEYYTPKRIIEFIVSRGISINGVTATDNGRYRFTVLVPTLFKEMSDSLEGISSDSKGGQFTQNKSMTGYGNQVSDKSLMTENQRTSQGYSSVVSSGTSRGTSGVINKDGVSAKLDERKSKDGVLERIKADGVHNIKSASAELRLVLEYFGLVRDMDLIIKNTYEGRDYALEYRNCEFNVITTQQSQFLVVSDESNVKVLLGLITGCCDVKIPDGIDVVDSLICTVDGDLLSTYFESSYVSLYEVAKYYPVYYKSANLSSLVMPSTLVNISDGAFSPSFNVRTIDFTRVVSLKSRMFASSGIDFVVTGKQYRGIDRSYNRDANFVVNL